MRACPRIERSKGACGLPLVGFSTPRSPGGEIELILHACPMAILGMVIACSQALSQPRSLPEFCYRASETLSVAQQRQCAELRAASHAPTKFGQEERKPNWTKVEAENGQVYDIDLNSIYRFEHAATATIYIQEGASFTPLNLRGVLFTCPDFMTILEGSVASQSAVYLPPHSIGRRLADIACAGVAPHN